MGFRGIDPDGLTKLSNSLRAGCEEIGGLARRGVAAMSRHGLGASATELAGRLEHVATWGDDTAAHLQRRADLIATGQRTGANPWARLLARYAIEARLGHESLAHWVESHNRVDTAVADITGWLQQRWNDWDVTNDDLHNIALTLRQLSAAELTDVIAALSPRQLERWISELGNGSNGFSRAEKQDLFALLAAGTDGEQIARLNQAILEIGRQTDVLDFGEAIRVHSADGAIVEFITMTMATDLRSHRYSTVAPALAVGGIDDAARAATTAAGLVAGEGVLLMVYADSLVTSGVEDTGEMCAVVDPLATLLATLTRTPGGVMSEEVFAAIAGVFSGPAQLGNVLEERHHTGADDAMLDENRVRLLRTATSLLLGDIDSTITALATVLDPDGALTAAYLHELVRSQDYESLSRITHALRTGDVVDPIRFAEPGSDPHYPYPHAQNLAYLAATLTTALERYAADAQDRIDAIDNAAGLVTTIVGPLVGTSTVGDITVGAGETILDATGRNADPSSIETALDNVLLTVQMRLQPSADNTVSVPGGDLAWQSWLARFRTVTAPTVRADSRG